MWALLRKEINEFFNSLIGYIAIVVFLIANGVFLWVLPGTNIFDFGYATLERLFELAPWVFMFLIPAITMRSIAEETRSGTIEMLTTKPLTSGQIVGAKYLAGLVVVLFSIVPTFLYLLTIYLLAEPVGNVDMGATWGSYMGLLFLAGGYLAIGMFASSVTENQIIAFILALLLCFTFYGLLEWSRDLLPPGLLNDILEGINIQSHYVSIRRGVVDTHDLTYFVTLSLLFLLLTKTRIESRLW
jgi:ABC-2 type transport system permease protein